MQLKKIPIQSILLVLNQTTLNEDLREVIKSINSDLIAENVKITNISSQKVEDVYLDEYDLIILEASFNNKGGEYSNSLNALTHLLNNNHTEKIALITFPNSQVWDDLCFSLQIPKIHKTDMWSGMNNVLIDQIRAGL